MKKIYYFLLILLLSLTVAGCAGRKPSQPKSAYIKTQPGLYHEVKPKETLWAISQRYGVELSEIVRANKIPDASKISPGQKIFIPAAAGQQEKKHTLSIKAESNFIWPLTGKVIANFGVTYNQVKNKGIIISTYEGASVKASRSGEVVFASSKLKGFGKTVILDHHDNFVTVYAHNSEILVKPGDYVKQGEVIARAGSTGRTQTAQLYFEIRQGHKPQNPFYYLP